MRGRSFVLLDNRRDAGEGSDGMSEREEGAAGSGEGTEGQANGQQGGGTANGAPQDSANKLIKDFAKARGVTVAELIAQFQGLEDANKTELQRAVDKAGEWERKYGDLSSKLRDRDAEQAIRDAAATQNARADRLGHIWRLVKDGVAFGDDGKPSNVAALIAQAKQDSPEWFQAFAGSGDGGKGGATDQDPNAAINRAIRQSAGYTGT